ncbi:23S rRNA (adenine(2503)-C(2))-methyltransferase @ tRNA (adenine(37)-C(2))-methyltransferase, partial [hydrothermal vent metagenome]
PAMERIEKFMKIASSSGTMIFPRNSRGADILAACGQLRESV